MGTVVFAPKTSRRLDARKSSLRRLVAGGVQANAEIVAPAGSTVADVQSAINGHGQSSLATSIVGAVLNTSGVEAAAPGFNLTQLENLRADMETALSLSTAWAGPQVTTTEMVLDPSSPLANAAQQNLATTTSPATVDGGATMVTTTVTAGEATSGSRGLVAMTITTAAGAVLVAVSA